MPGHLGTWCRVTRAIALHAGQGQAERRGTPRASPAELSPARAADVHVAAA